MYVKGFLHQTMGTTCRCVPQIKFQIKEIQIEEISPLEQIYEGILTQKICGVGSVAHGRLRT